MKANEHPTISTITESLKYFLLVVAKVILYYISSIVPLVIE